MRSHHLGFGCVLLVVCLGGMIAIAQGQPEPTLALLRSGTRPLVVGGVSEYTPFNVVGPDGQLTGMDREIIRAAAKRLGIKQVDFKTMTFGKLGQSLLDGKIDVIANNYWPTPDRERLYAFTISRQSSDARIDGVLYPRAATSLPRLAVRLGAPHSGTCRVVPLSCMEVTETQILKSRTLAYVTGAS